MIPQSKPREDVNSSKVNLAISVTFHALIVGTLLYFAARQGLLGKQLRKITVEMVKEKPPEKPKEPEPPKPEPPKIEAPKIIQEVPQAATTLPPPASVTAAAPPVIAPAATEMPAFAFDGGKTVESSSDPIELYRGFVQYSLQSHWNRPQDKDDFSFVAEVEVAVSPQGELSDPVWKKSSGDQPWDDSVRRVLSAVKNVNRPPPKNFPSRVIIRFDVVQAQNTLP